MPTPSVPLPPNVLQALQRGQMIEAIKLLRASTGLGLKEAKDLIDAHVRGSGKPGGTPSTSGALPAAVESALRRGNKLEAIKLLRERTGMELKEAKEAVEAVYRPADSAYAGHASGEVPASRSPFWILVTIVIAALLGYYFLR